MLYFGIKPEDVESRLFIDSGHDQGFVFARENGKVVTVVEPVVDSVMAGIKEKGIDCLILDPVVSFRAVAENDNTKPESQAWSCPALMDGLGLRRACLGHHVSFRIRWAKDTRGPNGDGTGCRSLR